MSAIFKNSKKKLSQHELRRMMNEHKEKQKPAKKIESPLAKINELGQLTCVLCKTVVRSEAVWTVHLNTKQHKENISLAKKIKEHVANAANAPKRPPSPREEVPAKKIKGILKNSSSKTSKAPDVPDDFFDSNPKPMTDSKAPNPLANKKENSTSNSRVESMEVDGPSDVLPEGFFDDPKLDAKARNLEYKDPAEEEWEKFLKEMKEVNDASAAIIAEDQEEATVDRQIDDIDEQMRNWSRVLELERKKEEVKQAAANEAAAMEESSDSGDEAEFDEFLDWRTKKAYK